MTSSLVCCSIYNIAYLSVKPMIIILSYWKTDENLYWMMLIGEETFCASSHRKNMHTFLERKRTGHKIDAKWKTLTLEASKRHNEQRHTTKYLCDRLKERALSLTLFQCPIFDLEIYGVVTPTK
ncbi:LOW QUALITY PROTEIN: hypothetical protein BC938DRAFT_484151 [Jimgerdemannia flammicorona]|uniref:Uncharacterized protein n=1 Tax=Jimgerdemannia flammicorona TaxID=994334 RepID=A0A433QAF7_9FUNG|nr:LOW QUALITY PROTEIN: hypothetical protein BC938DRAFT_484151 [Jimgerdemannia flammicorona]